MVLLFIARKYAPSDKTLVLVFYSHVMWQYSHKNIGFGHSGYTDCFFISWTFFTSRTDYIDFLI